MTAANNALTVSIQYLAGESHPFTLFCIDRGVSLSNGVGQCIDREVTEVKTLLAAIAALDWDWLVLQLKRNPSQQPWGRKTSFRPLGPEVR